MVSRVDFDGPSQLTIEETSAVRVFRTAAVRVEVTLENVEVAVFDTASEASEFLLMRFAYSDLKANVKQLTWTNEWGQETSVVGLAERYSGEYGSTNGGWAGKDLRVASNAFGNAAHGVYHEGEWRGMAELMYVPVGYFLGPGHRNYALFFDNVYRKEWFFSDPARYRCEMWGDHVRFYVIAGRDLPSLRTQYMQLTGYSPMPPRRVLGMTQSIFGYRSWEHIAADMDSLRRPSDSFDKFPVDSVGMDIYWFGGRFFGDSTEDDARQNSRMGDLHWDREHFPDPVKNLQRIRQEDGATMSLIQESYVSEKTKAYPVMDRLGLFARDCDAPDCRATYLRENHWWGTGGMADWSRPATRTWWFDCKICPLLAECEIDVDKCGEVLFNPDNPSELQSDAVSMLWLDLGEPEMYNPSSVYHGWTDDDGTQRRGHGDYHNLHQLFWSQGIAEGFARKQLRQRPWMLTRSGSSGLQRFGCSVWTGDVWPSLEALANSINVEMHMSMIGIDYVSSDVGGFQRKFFSENVDDTFTQWFAASAWTDIPLRPHSWQPDFSDVQTAPSRVGHLRSNLFNLRTRLSLTPYYYSLAYRAYKYAEPVTPPVFYYWQDDVNVRNAGHERMIGKDVLVVFSASTGQYQRDVYLMGGESWYHFHTNVMHDMTGGGGWIRNVQQYVAREPYCASPSETCLFTVPVFVRAGALIPKMFVDEHTRNAFGERDQESFLSKDLIVKMYPDFVSHSSGEFTLYEDDGESVAYQKGEGRTTKLRQAVSADGKRVTVNVEPAQGSFDGAPERKQVTVELVLPREMGKQVHRVTCGGEDVGKVDTVAVLSQRDRGWAEAPELSEVHVRCGGDVVGKARVVVFELA